MELPSSYIITKIYSHCDRVVHKKYRKVYNFECPVCREGKSKGRKRRGYYIQTDNYFCCHNCSKTWQPFQWIKEVCNLTPKEIFKEAIEYDDSLELILEQKQEKKKENPYTLPKDCINLTDSRQIEFFQDKQPVKDCYQYLINRRMLTAVNRPKYYYTSLVDNIHRNRLIIPFFNEDGKIIFYQSRAVQPKDEKFGKYLSKSGADFSVFGVDRIDLDFPYIFQFEGPIDSMFVRNGVAIGGLNLTEIQECQLEKFKLHQRIWVLDNQLDNNDVKQKYLDLIESNENVFIWPKKYKQFKDLNEICIHLKLDKIKPKFFLDNTYQGMQALLKLQ